MMELQLIIFPVAVVAISLWMIAWHHKVRGQEQLLRPGIVPIQRREGADIQIFDVFLPQSNIEFFAEVQDFLVIGEDGIKQMDSYELNLLTKGPGHSRPVIETFSLAD